MAGRKNTDDVVTENVTEAETSVDPAGVEAPAAPVRRPRAPRQVTDLPSASAAFNRAKRVADKADAALAEARENAAQAHRLLTTAAQALKGYSDEVSAAASAVLPEVANYGPDAD